MLALRAGTDKIVRWTCVQERSRIQGGQPVSSEMCWFCKQNLANSTPLAVGMSIVTATNIIGLPVRYNVLTVLVPRCTACHSKGNLFAMIAWMPFLFAIAAIGYYYCIADGTSSWPLVGAGVSVVWFLVFAWIDIRTTGRRIDEYPEIAALLRDGWDIGIPINTRRVDS